MRARFELNSPGVALGLALGLVLGLASGLAGCKKVTGFQEVKKHTTRFVDLTKKRLEGHQRLVYPLDGPLVVPGDVTHPTLEGRWSFSDQEKPVDVFVVRAADYDPDVEPSPLHDIFFSSIQGAVAGVGTLRAKAMHKHPPPGSWLVVFYNGADPGALTTA